MKSITTKQLKELLATSEINLLDVRELDEYEENHIPLAQLIPLSTFPEAINGLDKSKEYYLICRSGRRSQQAGTIMEFSGLNVINVEGGQLAYDEEI